MRRAILFAVGNTVVSDSLDAARALCSGEEGKKASKQSSKHRRTMQRKSSAEPAMNSSKIDTFTFVNRSMYITFGCSCHDTCNVSSVFRRGQAGDYVVSKFVPLYQAFNSVPILLSS